MISSSNGLSILNSHPPKPYGDCIHFVARSLFAFRSLKLYIRKQSSKAITTYVSTLGINAIASVCAGKSLKIVPVAVMTFSSSILSWLLNKTCILLNVSSTNAWTTSDTRLFKGRARHCWSWGQCRPRLSPGHRPLSCLLYAMPTMRMKYTNGQSTWSQIIDRKVQVLFPVYNILLAGKT